MLSARTEHVGPNLTVTHVSDPELDQLHPARYAAVVRADALEGRIAERWPGDGRDMVERPLLDMVSAICGRDLAGDGSLPNVATIRSAMRRWALRRRFKAAAAPAA